MSGPRQARSPQQETWATGDFHQLGVEQLIVGERLCEEVDVRPAQRVLDVACGAGNTALAAARRRASATGCDFVPALMARAEQRAQAEGLEIEWVEADAQNLPFEDGAFDVVLSTFGAMFAADQQRAADELLRVCRLGGTIGMANWTPASAIGDIFRPQLEPGAQLRTLERVAAGRRDRRTYKRRRRAGRRARGPDALVAPRRLGRRMAIARISSSERGAWGVMGLNSH